MDAMNIEKSHNRFRSLMFVPAVEKMLRKIIQYNADAYIIDLEDSIIESDKSDALERCVAALNEMNSVENIFVRLNKNLAVIELERLKKFKGLGFMLPKFESAEDYAEFCNKLKGHYTIALVETPKGVVNISSIAMCKNIDAIAFGAEDYTASVNMKNEDGYLNGIKLQIVANAKAFNKKVFDTPSFKVGDEKSFECEVDNSVSLGFDGKLLIHPKHIEYINNAFGCADIDYMRKVVEAFEKSGEAVFVYDGKVYEKMHITRFKRVIKENGGF